ERHVAATGFPWVNGVIDEANCVLPRWPAPCLDGDRAYAGAAADVECLPSHKAVLRIGKKHHCTGHIVSPAQTLHWNAPGDILLAFAASRNDIVEHVGLYGAGSHDVDGDALG